MIYTSLKENPLLKSLTNTGKNLVKKTPFTYRFCYKFETTIVKDLSHTLMFSFLDIHKKMLPNTLSMIFKGSVTFDLIDSIVTVISNRLEKIEGNVNTRKKVFGVLIECLQNLGNHVDEIKEEAPSDGLDKNSILFMIDTLEDGYRIVTANFIPNERVEGLKNWIEEINSLSREDVRKKYNEILQNNTFSEKGGGGLGFLDIALKIGRKMEYNMQPINESVSFFTFQITVNKDTRL